MSTIIYINNDQIQIARQNGKKISTEVIDLDVGTVLNGAIINSQGVIDKLKVMKKNLKDVTVLISSSSVQVKKIDLPVLPKKHLSTIIKGEFELASSDAYLFSGGILQKNKNSTSVLCVAVQKEIIKNYVDLFKKAGVKIKRIDTLCSSIVKYAHQNAVFKESSHIINVMSGHNMLSVLFENGEYKLINRNRLISELGTPAFVSEVYNKLSSMVQFNRSSEHTIQRSFYLGMQEEEVERLKLYAENDGVVVSSYTAANMLEEGSSACFGLASLKIDINLYAEYQESLKKKVETPVLVRNISLILILTSVMGAWYLTIFTANYNLQRDIDPLEDYLSSSAVIRDLALLDELNANIALYDLDLSEYDKILSWVDSGLVLSPEVMTLLAQDVVMDTFSYNVVTQTVQLSGANATMQENTDYIEGLRNSGFFTEIYYTNDVFSGLSDGSDRYLDNWSNSMTYEYKFTATAILNQNVEGIGRDEVIVEEIVEDEIDEEVEELDEVEDVDTDEENDD